MKKNKILALFAALAIAMGIFGTTTAYSDSANKTLAKVKQDAKKIKTAVTEDFDKAIADAKKEGKIVMLEFTGSQWCPPCKMFHKFILDSEKFAKYAEDKMKVVVADFDRSGTPTSKAANKQHAKLAADFNVEAFPTIILINPKTNAMAGMKGLPTTSPDEFIEMIESFKVKSEPAASQKPAAKDDSAVTAKPAK